MTARGRVRQHTRKTASGKTTTVRQHTRGLVSPRHSWGLFRRAMVAGRRKRKVTAFVLGGLAFAELGAWLTLSGLALILGTAAVLAGATAFLAASAGGMPAPSSGGRKPPQRGRPLQDDPPTRPPKPAAPKPAPARPKPASQAKPPQASDPVAEVNQLGALWSDDLDKYMNGERDASKLHCVLCQCAPCRCPPFGSDAYFKLLDFRHGRGKGGSS
jgi:hypothetical protein